MKIIIGIGICLLFASSSILASNSVTEKVSLVGTYGNGDLFVSTDTIIDEAGCPNLYRFDIPSSHPQIKTWVSIAMAALASGKSIKFKTSGCFAGKPTMDESRNSFVMLLNQS